MRKNSTATPRRIASAPPHPAPYKSAEFQDRASFSQYRKLNPRAISSNSPAERPKSSAQVNSPTPRSPSAIPSGSKMGFRTTRLNGMCSTWEPMKRTPPIRKRRRRCPVRRI